MKTNNWPVIKLCHVVSKKNVALFGGAFDPPHRGHRQVLEFLENLPQFDHIWVVPVFAHPFSKEMTSFLHRKKMCHFLIEGLTPKVSVCTIEDELKQSPSYTINTVRALKERFPNYHFTLVIGSDCKNDFSKWKEAENLKKEVSLFFIPRSGFEESPFDDISSTALRKMIRDGKQNSGHIMPLINQYIEYHHLYR